MSDIMKVLKNRTLLLFLVATLVVTIVNMPLLRPAESSEPKEIRFESLAYKFAPSLNDSGPLHVVDIAGNVFVVNRDAFETEKVLSTGTDVVVDVAPISSKLTGNENGDLVLLAGQKGSVKLFSTSQPEASLEFALLEDYSDDDTAPHVVSLRTNDGETFYAGTNDGQILAFSLVGMDNTLPPSAVTPQPPSLPIFKTINVTGLAESLPPITSLAVTESNIYAAVDGGRILTFSLTKETASQGETTVSLRLERETVVDGTVLALTVRDPFILATTTTGGIQVVDLQAGSVATFNGFQETYTDIALDQSGETLYLMTNANIFRRTSLNEIERNREPVLQEPTPIRPQAGPAPIVEGEDPYDATGLFALIDENGVVLRVVVGGSVTWLQERLGGVWVETWENREGHTTANVGMVWDGQDFRYVDQPPQI